MQTDSLVPETDHTPSPPLYDLLLLTHTKDCWDPGSIQTLIKDIREFSSRRGVIIQFFDADSIYGREQVISALYHALRSGADGRSRTRDISVDITRYAAGDRQIHNALDSVGLRAGTYRALCFVFYPHKARIMMKGMEQDRPFENELLDLFRNHNLIPAHDTPPDDPLHGKREDLPDVLEKMALVDLKL